MRCTERVCVMLCWLSSYRRKKKTAFLRRPFNVVIKASLEGVNIDPEHGLLHRPVHFGVPALPLPSNQSTFLINCIQMRHRLVKERKKSPLRSLFPQRLVLRLNAQLFLPLTSHTVSPQRPPFDSFSKGSQQQSNLTQLSNSNLTTKSFVLHFFLLISKISPSSHWFKRSIGVFRTMSFDRYRTKTIFPRVDEGCAGKQLLNRTRHTVPAYSQCLFLLLLECSLSPRCYEPCWREWGSS